MGIALRRVAVASYMRRLQYVGGRRWLSIEVRGDVTLVSEEEDLGSQSVILKTGS